MTDEEKKEIFGVSRFPYTDLSDLIAGIPPDKDFSNAKPSNQVNANTFQTFIEPYVRPLTEEDIGFLKERGDRVTPFVMPPRGKKHYTDVWAEEDGSISLDSSGQSREKLPANQPRGSVDQIDDATAETDTVSAGPVLNRLLSSMRFEHRTPQAETNGDAALPNGDSASQDPEAAEHPTTTSDPPATQFPESTAPGWKVPTTSPTLTHAQMDERIKQELRFLGFSDPTDPAPDFDAHKDDAVAERLRILQTELKRISVLNGARKARLLDLAKERLAYQEFATIQDDLGSQVQQAYLKRNRTMGKGKKNVSGAAGMHGKRSGPSGAGGVGGVAKQGIGDQARTLMARRTKWEEVVGPVFEGQKMTVPGEGESIFKEKEMHSYLQAEEDGWDDLDAD